MPGELVGTRAGWPAGSDATLESLAARARVTRGTKARQTIYRQIQRRLNAVGPFFPLLQPTQVFVSTKDLKGAVFNAQYQVDVTQVSPK
jgi:peptide/nickel transport system substrate-binding protein